MKVTSKMSMKEYDDYCNQELKKKIPFPDKKDWRRVLGDCIYDFSTGTVPRLRKLLHNENDKDTDLGEKIHFSQTTFIISEARQ
jgi:hypothetical protein